MTGPRLLFIDNLRVLMITLVIMVHLAITYGGEGSWFYKEVGADTLTTTVLTLHNATAQSFFMGLLFLLSAYLAIGSYDRKGPGRFLKDRFLRLGVPLLIYEFIIHPLQIYPLIKTGAIDVEGSFPELLARYYTSFHIGSGPLWFVETLLIFTLLYAAIRLASGTPTVSESKPSAPPGLGTILAFAVALGVLTFLARLYWPIGWAFGPLNLQLCFFVQYVAMLVVGVCAYRCDWLARLPEQTGRSCLIAAAVLIVVVLPLVFVLGGALQGNVSSFMGGWHWQAFTYAMWEQTTGLAMMVGLGILFRERFNRQGRLAKEAGASSYAAYIIHTPILILFTLAVRNIQVYSLLKFALAVLILVPMCFALGAALQRAPLARRVL